MPHPLVLALFDDAGRAAEAARALREFGVRREDVSIVARSHDEEGVMAEASDASPGAEFEDSWRASRLGELSAHLLAAIAVVMPGIGPIVADGPLAAGLGEAAGHVGGSLAKTLTRAGLTDAEAAEWEARIEAGAFLLGAHATPAQVIPVQDRMARSGAERVRIGSWK